MIERLAIYGAGGMGRHVAQIADAYDIVFVSDAPDEIGRAVNGIQVIGFNDLCSPEHRDREVAIAIADGGVRRRLVQRCEAVSLRFAAITARTAAIFRNCSIGEGAIITSFALVEPDATIGRHLHLHAYSYIAHDCIVGDFVTFGPRASCNGNVIIEDDVYLGTGVIVRPGEPAAPLRIGRGAYVATGSVVTRDVPANSAFAGNPGRVSPGRTRSAGGL